MSAPSQTEVEAVAKARKQAASREPDDKKRSVNACNFRLAGRLSNESARSLSTIHETLARQLSSTLEDYLRTEVEVKLQGIDQLPITEHMASTSSLSYIVPFSLGATPGTVVVECDIDVAFPIIELLMGGTVDSTSGSANGARELSEIEEEIMRDTFLLIARQAELTWHLPSMTLEAGSRIKPSLLQQYYSPNGKVVILKFTMEVAGTTGSFRLIVPALFANALISKTKVEQPQTKSRLRFFPMPSIRERILDCDVAVAASLLPLKVAVRDLIALQPGSVLKLRAPVRMPGALTLEGYEIFEAAPVRNGAQKAAQLGRMAQRMCGGEE